jgi:aconitate hydratase
MLAIGAGGLDVACAMGGSPYYFPLPRIVRVVLTGRLRPWVAAKDVILELLRRLTVRGGFGKIFEYSGPGVATLTVPQRATIANMGAELGLTTSIFPSDDVTRAYRARLVREATWRPLAADPGAAYDDTFEIDLSAIEPLVAVPGSPDNVVPVGEVEGTSIEQVLVGSCTNGSWEDMSVVAEVLRGQRVHPDVSFVLFPASQQVLETMARQGLVADLIAAGGDLRTTCGRAPGSPRAGLGIPQPPGLQPQLPGPERRQGRPGVSVLHADRLCLGAAWRDHGSAAARRGARGGLPRPLHRLHRRTRPARARRA